MAAVAIVRLELVFHRTTSNSSQRVEARFESLVNVAIVQVLPIPMLPIPNWKLDLAMATFSHWQHSFPSTPGLGNSASGERRYPSDSFYDAGVDTFAANRKCGEKYKRKWKWSMK